MAITDEDLAMVLHVEGEPRLVIETNINLEPKDTDLYADVWQLQREYTPGHANELLKAFRGPDALSDAVIHLAELLKEPIAHKLVKGSSR